MARGRRETPVKSHGQHNMWRPRRLPSPERQARGVGGSGPTAGRSRNSRAHLPARTQRSPACRSENKGQRGGRTAWLELRTEGESYPGGPKGRGRCGRAEPGPGAGSPGTLHLRPGASGSQRGGERRTAVWQARVHRNQGPSAGSSAGRRRPGSQVRKGLCAACLPQSSALHLPRGVLGRASPSQVAGSAGAHHAGNRQGGEARRAGRKERGGVGTSSRRAQDSRPRGHRQHHAGERARREEPVCRQHTLSHAQCLPTRASSASLPTLSCGVGHGAARSSPFAWNPLSLRGGPRSTPRECPAGRRGSPPWSDATWGAQAGVRCRGLGP